MMVPQNVSSDILFLTATLHLVIKFKYLQYKQHIVILCRTHVRVGGGVVVSGFVLGVFNRRYN